VYSNGFNNNILPVIQITQAAISFFRKKKCGKIITVLSSAIIGKPLLGSSAYTAEKQYLLSLAKSWAIENAAFNITSNCVSPDFMLTAIHKDVDERIIEGIKSASPLKRLLSVEEVSEIVMFLLNATSQMNGVNIPINAGNSIL
jgi:NAD(P)-dependent dehydrogenase (short-subunit alcohol dehydrogenase family)